MSKKTIQVKTIKVKGSQTDAERAFYNWVQNSNINEIIKVSYNLLEIEKTQISNPNYAKAIIEQYNYDKEFDKYLSDSYSLNPFKAKKPEKKISFKTWYDSVTPYFIEKTEIWEVLIMYK